VIIVNGFAAAYLRRGERELLLFLPDDEPRRSQMGRDGREHADASGYRARRGLSRDAHQRNQRHQRTSASRSTTVPRGRLCYTALGLQARTERLGRAGLAHSIPLALHCGDLPGGTPMADNDRDVMSEVPNQSRDETTDREQEQIRSSNDRDQETEREGEESEHNRGDDEAVRGLGHEGGDVDPDSAESDIDRDDTSTD
jgi:hypothetical protein